MIEISKVKNDGDMFLQEMLETDRVASWERFGSGFLSIRMRGHSTAKWISFSVMEKGNKSSKEVMFSLQGDALKALRDACNIALGESA